MACQREQGPSSRPGVGPPSSPRGTQSYAQGGQRPQEETARPGAPFPWPDLKVPRVCAPWLGDSSFPIPGWGKQEGSRTLSLSPSAFPTPPLAPLKAWLESLPRFPHLSKKAASCYLLCLLVTLSGGWEFPERRPWQKSQPLILSLSSLTATIIIIWRDRPEVVRDVVGVNETKKSSVCAVSPG